MIEFFIYFFVLKFLVNKYIYIFLIETSFFVFRFDNVGSFRPRTPNVYATSMLLD